MRFSDFDFLFNLFYLFLFFSFQKFYNFYNKKINKKSKIPKNRNSFSSVLARAPA